MNYICDCGRSFTDPDGPIMCADSNHGKAVLDHPMESVSPDDDVKFERQLSMVEVMGHKRLFGYVTEEEHAGTVMIRVDTDDFTQYLTAQAIFSIVPIKPDLYEACRKNSQEPLGEYDLQAYHDLKHKYYTLQRQHRAIREQYPDWEPKADDPQEELPY